MAVYCGPALMIDTLYNFGTPALNPMGLMRWLIYETSQGVYVSLGHRDGRMFCIRNLYSLVCECVFVHVLCVQVTTFLFFPWELDTPGLPPTYVRIAKHWPLYLYDTIIKSIGENGLYA